jgi:hypothetical protein
MLREPVWVFCSSQLLVMGVSGYPKERREARYVQTTKLEFQEFARQQRRPSTVYELTKRPEGFLGKRGKKGNAYFNGSKLLVMGRVVVAWFSACPARVQIPRSPCRSHLAGASLGSWKAQLCPWCERTTHDIAGILSMRGALGGRQAACSCVSLAEPHALDTAHEGAVEMQGSWPWVVWRRKPV